MAACVPIEALGHEEGHLRGRSRYSPALFSSPGFVMARALARKIDTLAQKIVGSGLSRSADEPHTPLTLNDR